MYHLTKDIKFSIIKNKYKQLSEQQKEILDEVIEKYGMYNYKGLEKLVEDQI